MRLKPFPIHRYITPVRCRPGTFRQVNPCLIRCTAGKQHHPPFPADVLLIDATNILSRAASDAKRCSTVPGVSIRRCFEAWIQFLLAATTATAPQCLVIACFDNPAAGSNRKQQNNEDYLRRRRRRRGENKNNSSTLPTPNAGKLTPFVEYIESLEGGIALLSGGGYEADECIGAVCTLFLSPTKKISTTTTLPGLTTQTSASVLIASGDADMQEYLSTTISWLQIESLPTLTTPSALSVVTETSFLDKNNFPPAAYSDYLALVGKKEANIGGLSIGSSLAAKLLKQFHSVQRIQNAAQKGILKGWPPAVEALFLSDRESKAGRLLARNLDIFTSSTDPELVLTSEQREKVLSKTAAIFYGKSKTGGAAAAVAAATSPEPSIAWLHPLHAIRWLQAGPLAQTLAHIIENTHLVGPCQVQATTPEGLPIDLVVGGGGSDGGSDGSRGIGVMVCAPCDFNSTNDTNLLVESTSVSAEEILNNVLNEIEAARNQANRRGGLHDPWRVVKTLNRAAQHHISLLKKSGADVVLIPWWFIASK